MRMRQRIFAALSTGVLAAGLLSSQGAYAMDKYKIYLSMSYIGNDWQGEAANMVKAMAVQQGDGRQGRPASAGVRP